MMNSKPANEGCNSTDKGKMHSWKTLKTSEKKIIQVSMHTIIP